MLHRICFTFGFNHYQTRVRIDHFNFGNELVRADGLRAMAAAAFEDVLRSHSARSWREWKFDDPVLASQVSVQGQDSVARWLLVGGAGLQLLLLFLLEDAGRWTVSRHLSPPCIIGGGSPPFTG